MQPLSVTSSKTDYDINIYSCSSLLPLDVPMLRLKAQIDGARHVE
jgi:hypothetical protein